MKWGWMVVLLTVLLVAFAAGIWLTAGSDEDASPGETATGAGQEAAEQTTDREYATSAGSTEISDESPSQDPRDGKNGDTSLDYTELKDIDSTRAELESRFEAGDSSAAVELAELTRRCQMSLAVGREHFEREAAESKHPDEYQALIELADELDHLREPCRDSALADTAFAQQTVGYWMWAAAEAGDVSALRQVVFGRYTAPEVAQHYFGDPDEDQIEAERRNLAEELRGACDAGTLNAFARRFEGNYQRVEGLEYGNHDEPGSDTSRGIEAFAHQYAASRLEGHSQPGREARNLGDGLTPGQEQRARELAESIIAGC